MADLATLRRRQNAARLAWKLAQAQPPWRPGRAKAQRAYVRATAELMRAELNHRIAAPLLNAHRRQLAPADDLFSQIGA